MAEGKIIDGAVTKAHIATQLNIGGLAPGDSRNIVLHKNILSEAAGVTHADMINAHGLSIKSHVSGDDDHIIGVSVMKGGATTDELEQLQTSGRQIFIGDNGIAQGYHHVGHKNANESSVHPIIDKPLTDAEKTIIKKRGMSWWSPHNDKTAHEGTFKSEVDTGKDGKKETKFLASKNSAVHTFVSKNIRLPQYAKFSRPENHATAPNGEDAIVMTEPEFKSVYGTLVTSLKPSGMFENGITIRATNLGEKRIASDARALIETTFHRTPFDQTREAHPVVYEDADPISVSKANPIHPKATSEPKVEPFTPEEPSD